MFDTTGTLKRTINAKDVEIFSMTRLVKSGGDGNQKDSQFTVFVSDGWGRIGKVEGDEVKWIGTITPPGEIEFKRFLTNDHGWIFAEVQVGFDTKPSIWIYDSSYRYLGHFELSQLCRDRILNDLVGISKIEPIAGTPPKRRLTINRLNGNDLYSPKSSVTIEISAGELDYAQLAGVDDNGNYYVFFVDYMNEMKDRKDRIMRFSRDGKETGSLDVTDLMKQNKYFTPVATSMIQVSPFGDIYMALGLAKEGYRIIRLPKLTAIK